MEEKRRRAQQRRQYERIVAPEALGEAGRKLAEQVNRVMDDIYRRYGRLRVNDFSEDVRAAFGDMASKQSLQALQEKVEKLSLEGQSVLEELPVGTWMIWAAQQAPSGKWMFAEGQELSVERYPEACTVFGERLPDMRGRVAVGMDARDTAFAGLLRVGGETTHTLTVEEMPEHSHAVAVAQEAGQRETEEGEGMGVKSQQGATAGAGGGAGHNNLQPYLTVRYMIKVLP